MRRLVACLRGDQRGFALQTTILMTALIAIALAVSAVIYTRGGQVKDDLERQNVTFDPSQAQSRAVCEAYQDLGWTWDANNDKCTQP